MRPTAVSAVVAVAAALVVPTALTTSAQAALSTKDRPSASAQTPGPYDAGSRLAPSGRVTVRTSASRGGTCTVSLSEISGFAIPDNTPGSITWQALDVPVGGTLLDANYAVNLIHTYDQDLYLYSGKNSVGAFQELSSANGGSGDNYLTTHFDDSAALSITSGTAPFNGNYRPEQALTNWNGSRSDDRYWFGVSDRAGGDVGRVNSWEITLTIANCDTDRDGVPDSADKCDTIAASTASGCPIAPRAVTLRYATGALRGKLSCTKAACAANKPVVIYKVRPGADLVVARVNTNVSGAFQKAYPASAHGSFYAVASTAVVADVAECAQATSNFVTR